MSAFKYLLALALTATFGLPAKATILLYTISGTDTLADGQTEKASFQIDTDRPVDGFADGIGFYYASVAGSFTYGTSSTMVPQDITFYLDAAHGYADPTTDPGGLFVGEGDLLGFSGPQLFDGPIDNPTLRTGSFTLGDAFSGSPISLQVTAIPEPATWALMVLGFGGLGFVMRRRGEVGAPA